MLVRRSYGSGCHKDSPVTHRMKGPHLPSHPLRRIPHVIHGENSAVSQLAEASLCKRRDKNQAETLPKTTNPTTSLVTQNSTYHCELRWQRPSWELQKHGGTGPAPQSD
jgi:hypothetical protein